MEWRRLRWKIVAASFLGGVVMFVSAHYLWQRTAVEKPLLQLLRQDPDVGHVTLRSENGSIEVQVELKAVPKLAATVERISTLVKNVYPRAPRITYKDRSNQVLDQIYHDMHFVVHQAARTGNYRDMANWVHALAHNANLHDYRVEVTSTAIYVQLHFEDYYLYRIIPLAVSRP